MKTVKSERYATYKGSGIDWIGEIPEKWKTLRLKDLGFLQNGISKSGDYFGFGFPFISYGNVYNNTISFEKIKTYANSTVEDQQAYSCREGDVFFTRTSETIEEIGFSAVCLKTIPKSVFSGFVIRFRPTSKELSKEFSKYYFSANILRAFFSKEVGIVTRASLGQGLLNKLSVILPSLSEQAAVAAYLDTKTAQINRQINLLRQKAAHYSELKQSLINETVTHGLNKTVPMKDSGVEWVGEMPEHWEVKRGKDIFEQTKNKAGLDSSLYDVLSLTLNGVIKRDLDNMKGKIPASFDGYQIANPGDLVLCLFDIDVTPRIVGYVNNLGIITSAYTVIKGKKKVDMKYFLYYYLEQNRNDSLLANSKTLRSTMTFDLFSQLLLPVPPLAEQSAIAAYLDEKTAQIDRIVNAVNSQIDKLKDLRKALINDVVTGKIKIVSEELSV